MVKNISSDGLWGNFNFYVVSFVMAVCAAFVVLGIYMVYSSYVDPQVFIDMSWI